MAFTHRDTQVATTASGTSLTISKPTGLAVGDLMVAWITKDDDPAISSTPTGWLSARAQHNTTDGYDLTTICQYKIADAADVAASNFTWQGDSEDWAGVISAFYGMTNGASLVQFSADKHVASPAAITSDSITTTSGNLLLGMVGMAQPASGNPPTITTSNFTTPVTMPTTGSGNGDVGACLAYRLSGGGESTVTAGNNESGSDSHIHLIEFEDAEPPTATFDQIAARAYTDGDETDAVMVGTDSTPTLKVGELYHVRFEIEESAGVDGTFTGQLERQLNSGSWADVSTSSTVVKAIQSWSVNVRGSKATTNRLDTSTETFVAGTVSQTGLSTSLTGFGSESTNLVYTVYIPAGDVAHNDTINLRVRNTHADGNPTYTQNLVVTVAETLTLPGSIPAEAHTTPESHGFFGPIKDSDGNLYLFTEPGFEESASAPQRANPIPVAWKSENGGKSWRTVQGYDNDSVRDLEGFSVSRHDPNTTGVVPIAKQNASNGSVQVYPYHTGDHATTPDTFETYETVTMEAQTLYEDNVVILERSDGDRVLVSGTDPSTDRIAYRWWNGSTWAAVQNIDAGTDTHLNPKASVCHAADRTVVVWKDHTNGDVLMRAFDAAGSAIGSAQQLNTLGVYSQAGEEYVVVDVVCYDDTNDYHLAVWKSADGTLYSNTIKWGGSAYTVGSEAQVSTTTVDGDFPEGNDTAGPTAALAVDETNGFVYAFYARSSDTDLYYNSWSESGGWDTETSLYVSSGNTDTVGYVSAQVFTHSAGNGGARVVGYVFDTFDVSTDETTNLAFKPMYYNEVALGTSATATPDDLIGQATFPGVTTANEVNATADQTGEAIPAAATFDPVTAVGEVNATATCTTLIVGSTFDAATTATTQDADAPLTTLAVSSAFDPVTTATTQDADAPLTVLEATATFDPVTAIGASDADAIATALTVAASFPTATAVSGSATQLTTLPAAASFDPVTVQLDQTPQPSSLTVTGTFSSVSASGEVNATAPLTLLAVSGTFPSVATDNDVNAVASLTTLVVQGTHPAVAAVGEVNVTVTLTTLAVDGSFPPVTAQGGGSASPQLSALTVTSTFPVVAVANDVNAAPSPAAFSVPASFPAAAASGSAVVTCTALTVTATFDPTSVVADSTATPTIHTVPGTFPGVAAVGGGSASPQLTALAVNGTFPAPTVVGEQNATATCTALQVGASFPPVTVENQVNSVAAGTALEAVASFPAVTASGEIPGTVTLTVLAVAGTFPATTTTVDSTIDVTALAVAATLPTAVLEAGAAATLTPFTVTGTFPAVSADGLAGITHGRVTITHGSRGVGIVFTTRTGGTTTQAAADVSLTKH